MLFTWFAWREVHTERNHRVMPRILSGLLIHRTFPLGSSGRSADVFLMWLVPRWSDVFEMKILDKTPSLHNLFTCCVAIPPSRIPCSLLPTTLLREAYGRTNCPCSEVDADDEVINTNGEFGYEPRESGEECRVRSRFGLE